MCRKGEKTLSFTYQVPDLNSFPTNPHRPLGGFWAIMESVCRAPLVLQQTVQTQGNSHRLQTSGRPCLRGILTVPFQHMNISSPGTNPMVPIKFSVSHSPRATAFGPTPKSTLCSKGAHILEGAELKLHHVSHANRLRSWISLLSRTEPQTSLIPVFLHNFHIAQEWRRGRKVWRKGEKR